MSMPTVESFFPQRAFDPSAPLCFVHVPKAAGTTVRLVVENGFAGDQVFPSGSKASKGRYVKVKIAMGAGDDLRDFRLLSGHFGAQVGEFLSPDANLFTWLREPAERVISEFFFFVRQVRELPLKPYLDRLLANERTEKVFLDWLGDRPADHHRLQGQLVFGNGQSYEDWKAGHPEIGLNDAAVAALRRCFFIGLMEDQERSLDALCAMTSILPPKQPAKLNVGREKPQALVFTADEQKTFDRLMEPEIAFYSLAKGIYETQLATLAGLASSRPEFAMIGDREALRDHILRESTARSPVLSAWNAWDPVLGENLDGREQLEANDGRGGRWRWTAPKPDTYLYFRFPRNSDFELRIRLAPATPANHATEARLSVEQEGMPLTLSEAPNGRVDLVAAITQHQRDRWPELVELHLHTPRMLDEGRVTPYAGTRKLGLAIESISAAAFDSGGLHRPRTALRRLADFAQISRRRLTRS